MSVEASVGLNGASETLWDVLVIGAGPSGAIAAREAALRGLSVLLIDKAEFPREKVCGCCLNRATLGLLEATGLGRLTGDLGARPLNRFKLAAAGHAATLSLPGGVALSREAFDVALVQAAKDAGAHFMPQTTATIGEAGADHRSVHLRIAGEEATARGRVILGAAGLAGKLFEGERDEDHGIAANSRIGASAIISANESSFEPGTINMACAAGGYVGLVILEDGRLNLAAALDPAFVRERGGLGEAAESIIQSAGFALPAGIRDSRWRGTPALTRRPSRVAAERFFALGDAAGYVEPITGEGISWALRCGIAAAPLAERACREGWSDSLARAWTEYHRRNIIANQIICTRLASVLRHPFVTRGVVRVLEAAPALARPIVRRLNALNFAPI